MAKFKWMVSQLLVETAFDIGPYGLLDIRVSVTGMTVQDQRLDVPISSLRASVGKSQKEPFDFFEHLKWVSYWPCAELILPPLDKGCHYVLPIAKTQQ